jgi:hypothetical protein
LGANGSWNPEYGGTNAIPAIEPGDGYNLDSPGRRMTRSMTREPVIEYTQDDQPPKIQELNEKTTPIDHDDKTRLSNAQGHSNSPNRKGSIRSSNSSTKSITSANNMVNRGDSGNNMNKLHPDHDTFAPHNNVHTSSLNIGSQHFSQKYNPSHSSQNIGNRNGSRNFRPQHFETKNVEHEQNVVSHNYAPRHASQNNSQDNSSKNNSSQNNGSQNQGNRYHNAEPNKAPELLLKSVEERVEDQTEKLKSLAFQISKTVPIESGNIPPSGGVEAYEQHPELDMEFSRLPKPAEADIDFEAHGYGSGMKRTTTGPLPSQESILINQIINGEGFEQPNLDDNMEETDKLLNMFTDKTPQGNNQ